MHGQLGSHCRVSRQVWSWYCSFPSSRNTAEPQPSLPPLNFFYFYIFSKSQLWPISTVLLLHKCLTFAMYSEARLWMSIMNIIILAFFLQSHLFLFRLKVQCTFGTEAFKWILLFKIYLLLRWCSSVPIVERPMQKSSYVHISYVGASKEMKIVENYEMKLVFLTSPP